ncbi:MAG TPA: zinc ribbon domain-containing protein [bacterium]|nr:zinc ribbon domain-containing protein [bacterium]
MPTYSYECQKCGNLFEEFQKISDAPLKKCPECKGKVQRIISGGAGVLFKCGGFYVTDSKKKNVLPASDKKTETKTGAAADSAPVQPKSKNQTTAKSDKTV